MDACGKIPIPGAMSAIAALTAAFAGLVALIMWDPSGAGSLPGTLLFGESLFAGPVIVACALAIWLRSAEARRAVLLFDIAFILFAALIYWQTFSGEHEAQYQLALL